MKKIRLNIALHRRINKAVFIPSILAAFIFTLLLFYFTYHLTSRYINDTRKMKNRLGSVKSELTKLEKEGETANIKIASEKSLWNPRIAYCNFLIEKKVYYLSERLNFLETVLPSEIQVASLQWKNAQNQMELQLIAPGFPQVLSTYKALAPYDLDLISDFEQDGRFHMNVRLKYVSK